MLMYVIFIVKIHYSKATILLLTSNIENIYVNMIQMSNYLKYCLYYLLLLFISFEKIQISMKSIYIILLIIIGLYYLLMFNVYYLVKRHITRLLMIVENYYIQIFDSLSTINTIIFK